MEVIFKGETIWYLLEDLVRTCLHICMVQGEEVGKCLWKLSLFSAKCDLFLPSFFYFILLAEFGFAFFFFFLKSK